MAPDTSDRTRIRELTQLLETKAADIDRIAESFRDETGQGHFVIPKEQHDDYVRAIGEAESIKSLIEAEERRGQITRFMGSAPPGGNLAAGDAAATQRGTMATKSLGQMWLESDNYANMREHGFDPNRFGGAFRPGLGIKSFEQATKDIYSSMAGTIAIPALGTPENTGLVPRQLRPGRVRDLFPAETTTANLLYGIRETGYVNAATVIPERTAADGTSPPTGGPSDLYGRKPPSNLNLVPVTYPVSTIAHVMYAHRNTLADEPRMQGLIDRDMMDGVKLQEDFQILYGDGIGDNMCGITNTPGIQTYPGSSADPFTAQMRRAITRVKLAYFGPPASSPTPSTGKTSSWSATASASTASPSPSPSAPRRPCGDSTLSTPSPSHKAPTYSAHSASEQNCMTARPCHSPLVQKIAICLSAML